MSAPTAEMRPWRITHAPDALTAAGASIVQRRRSHMAKLALALNQSLSTNKTRNRWAL